MEDPECRARLFRYAVWVTTAYFMFGFLVIILIMGGLLEF
jgi:hypothetical protein